MTESTLTSKMQAFISSLAPEETAQLHSIAQASLGQGEVQGYALGTVPAPLSDKLRAFAGSLALDELSEVQSAAQASDDDVQGYLGTIIPSSANQNMTYKEAFTLVTFAADSGVWMGPKPK